MINRKLIETILQTPGSDWQFEIFCARHYTKIEGIDYLTTSKTYDLGADAAAKERFRGNSYVICSLQQKDIFDKAMSSLKRLLQHRKRPASVRFCFPFLKSDQVASKIESAAKGLNKFPEYRVSGISQLCEEVIRNPDTFEHVYANEWDELRRYLQPPDKSPQDFEYKGLRVLLATQLNGDSVQLRRRILDGLVLHVISDVGIPINEVLHAAAQAVGLSRPIERSYLEETLRRLKEQGLIEVDAELRVRRTAKALEVLDEAGAKAAHVAANFQRAVKQSLQMHFEEINDGDYKKIWDVIRRGLIELFQRYGMEVVEFIRELNQSGTDWDRNSTPSFLLEGLQRIAQGIDRLELSLAKNRHSKLVQAVIPSLLDRESGTRRWLHHLCLSYICACSLGLHPDALKRLEARIKGWHVIPDTHVILSLFGCGEEDHDGITQVVSWWKNAGGRLLMIPPFLMETLHHAQMAREIIRRWSRRCKSKRTARNCPDLPNTNVFLRSIIAVMPSDKEGYIDQFISELDDGTSNISQILRDDYGFEVGPELTLDSSFTSLLLRKIEEIRLPEDLDDDDPQTENLRARCRRDAESLSYLSTHRKSLSSGDAVILSSSSRLRSLVEGMTDRFGYLPPYIDPAKLIFALSLVPGASFSFNSLDSILFGSIFQHQVIQHRELANEVVEKLASRIDKGMYRPALVKNVNRSLVSHWL